MSMKQVEVKIMGQGYLLGCPEGGEHSLAQAVQSVDSAMCKIRDQGKIRARDRIAVLAALNLAFELAERPAPQVTESNEVADPVLLELLNKLDAALGTVDTLTDRPAA